jgi:hypothetical protein
MPAESESALLEPQVIAILEARYPNFNSVETAAAQADGDPEILRDLIELCSLRTQRWTGSEVAAHLPGDYKRLAHQLLEIIGTQSNN